MPVSVLMPHQRPEPREKQEVDPMDKILKGLNIASSIFGLKEAYDKGQILKEDRELNKLKISQAAKEKEMEGITLLPKDLLSHGDKYSVADTNTPGSMKFMLKERGGNMKEIYLTPKQKEVDPLAQATKALAYQSLKNKVSEEKNIPQNVSAAATYAKRLEDANAQISGLMSKGYDPTTVGASIQGSSLYPERLRSEESKLMEQAKRNFLNAVLRRESGSAISPSEFESGNAQYFPSPGDTPAVLAQKERNRNVALAGMMAEGSRAMPRLERELPQQQLQVGRQMNVTGGGGLADLIQPKANAGLAGKKPAWAK